MKKNKKRFRVIRNKALEAGASAGPVTAAEVEQIFLAGQAEEARMAEICPAFNALMDEVWRRGSASIHAAQTLQEMRDDPYHLLWTYLLWARLQFFDELAARRQAAMKQQRDRP